MSITRLKWLPFSNTTLAALCSPEQEQMDYTFKITDSAEELLQAYHLLYHEYLQAGYITESANELLFTKHHLLPSTKVFVAKSEESVLSTATVFSDCPQFGLPMDELYGKELDKLRRNNRKILELGSLASNTYEFSLRGIQNFTRLVFLYCLFLDADDVCIMVNPKHAAFYRTRCEFETFGEEKHYTRVNAPAVSLRANLHIVREKLERHGINHTCREKLSSAYQSLKITLCAHILEVFHGNQLHQPPSTPLNANLINRLLLGKMADLKDLSMECRMLLNNSYSGLYI